jgi:acyl transferase domain-containing protein
MNGRPMRWGDDLGFSSVGFPLNTALGAQVRQGITMSFANVNQHEPIAIIGAGCRLPGAVDVPAFWELLVDGRDAVGEIPADRFDVNAHQSQNSRRGGRNVSHRGGYLSGIDGFDAGFFGIKPWEAVRLDPQQRLLLEVTWEALEDAGLPADRLAGSRTAVCTGATSSGYLDLLRRSGRYDVQALMGGSDFGMPAGRISYQFDLRGPSLGMQSSCATALLSVNAACDSIWSGHADLAIAGSANIILTPDVHLAMSEAGMLSRTGSCRFGDADADGFVRSEGVVVLVLKPLATALADGDLVYATIIGTAATHDGRTGGSMAAPGRVAQEELLRAACRHAAVAPSEIDYVEAHGPGTPLGDQAELAALGAVMGADRDPGQPCLIGSVKSNIGHTEVAAGLAGLLKTVLALQHQAIPASLHMTEPSATLKAGTALELVTRGRPWPQRSRPALAGVSSFGMSGTNVHIVLAAAPRPARPRRRPRPGPRLLPLSARSDGALRALAGTYADLLSAGIGPAQLADICFSAGHRRTHHPYRLALAGATARELADGLRAFTAAPARGPRVPAGRPKRTTRPPSVVFVFPGQGAQWVGMGRELLDTSPVFARALQRCSRAVQDELGWSPAERLRDDRPLRTTGEIQPVLWAVQVALAALWRHWGIEPDLLIGHSMGEIAAATVSGALSVRAAAAVVCRRAVLLDERAAPGAMWAVQLGEAEARRVVAELAPEAFVAVINSSQSTVLAGDPEVLRDLAGRLAGRGVYCKRVEVDYASHTPQIGLIRSELLRRLTDLRPGPGHVRLYSTVRDAVVDGTALDATYWADNLQEPVRFAHAVRAVLAGSRPTTFIEISPHPILSAAIETEIGETPQAAVVHSLRRDAPERQEMLSSLGRVYVLGSSPAWDRVGAGGGAVRLPGYPWQRKRFWPSEGGPRRTPAAAAQDPSPPTAVALTGTEPPEAVTGYLVDRLAELLAMAPEDIDLHLPPHQLGVDSLLAAQLRSRMNGELGVLLPAGALLGARTLAELAGDLSGRLAETAGISQANG